MIKLRRLFAAKRSPAAPAPRGTITEFSRASRRRLIELFARLSLQRVRSVFVTLTFSAAPSPVDAKAALKRLLMRWRRAYPKASAVWRMEFQERGAIHFHLICFHLPYIPQKELQAVWQQCTGEALSIVHITLLKGKKHAMSYVSKYVAKRTTPSGSTSLEHASYQHAEHTSEVGRAWGWLNQEALPMAHQRLTMFDDEQLARYFWHTAQVMSHGRAGSQECSCTVFTNDSFRMFDYIKRHAREGSAAAWLRFTVASTTEAMHAADAAQHTT